MSKCKSSKTMSLSQGERYLKRYTGHKAISTTGDIYRDLETRRNNINMLISDCEDSCSRHALIMAVLHHEQELSHQIQYLSVLVSPNSRSSRVNEERKMECDFRKVSREINRELNTKLDSIARCSEGKFWSIEDKFY